MFYKINFYENSTLLKVELTQALSIIDIEITAANLFTSNVAKESIFIYVSAMTFSSIGTCVYKMKKGKFAFFKSAKVQKDFYNIENHKVNIINHIELK
jgi:hypothetical protein